MPRFHFATSNTRLWTGFLCMLVGFSSFAYSTESTPSCELTMGWSHWPPFRYRLDDQTLAGLDIELVQLITEAVGCSLSFVELPQKRQLKYIQEGKLDMMPSTLYRKSRSGWAYYSAPYRVGTNSMLMLKGGTERYPLTSFNDILKYDFKVGIARGSPNGSGFDAAMNVPEFRLRVEAATHEQNLKKLLVGRIQGMIVGRISAIALARNMNVEGKVEFHPLPVLSGDVRVLFSKKSVPLELVDRFNKGLAKLKSQEVYTVVLDKYGSLHYAVP